MNGVNQLLLITHLKSSFLEIDWNFKKKCCFARNNRKREQREKNELKYYFGFYTLKFIQF